MTLWDTIIIVFQSINVKLEVNSNSNVINPLYIKRTQKYMSKAQNKIFMRIVVLYNYTMLMWYSTSPS